MSYQYPYGSVPPPGPPKSNTGRNIAIGCGVLILIGFILIGAIIAFFALVFTSDAPESTTKNDQDTGIAFAGKTPQDAAVPAGSTVNADGLRITATTLGTKKDTFLDGDIICSNVSVKNESDEKASFNTFDWSLQYPSGVIENWGALGGDNALTAGDLAPGGSVSGDVCFDYDGTAGEYVLLYNQSLWDSARYAWVSNR